MTKLITFLAVFFMVNFSFSQELKATVTVNYNQVAQANTQVFKTLEKQLVEFVNQTQWTQNYQNKAGKIPCSFYINVLEYEANSFKCSLQVQASRPVFNATYTTPLTNFNDKEFNFSYIEYENLFYDPNNFTSNLVSVLGFYANIIIGFEQDSFAPSSGTAAYENALSIMNVAQSSGFAGWNSNENNFNNRYYLITDLLSNTYKPFRETLYMYHINGLDLMADAPQKGKSNLILAIQTLSELQNVRPNSYLNRIFFDAKADEIVSIFSGGPKVSIVELLGTLQNISPSNSSKWAKVKY